MSMIAKLNITDDERKSILNNYLKGLKADLEKHQLISGINLAPLSNNKLLQDIVNQIDVKILALKQSGAEVELNKCLGLQNTVKIGDSLVPLSLEPVEDKSTSEICSLPQMPTAVYDFAANLGDIVSYSNSEPRYTLASGCRPIKLKGR
jgi:hypothetical protein